MPEEIEVDTDKLREAIDEEIERKSASLLRSIALTTAFFAALAAIGSLLAGGSINEALALKTEAAQKQAQASDQWAYYQAKGIKAAILKSQMELLAAQGKPVAPDLDETSRRYADEEKSISAAANELEKMRDEKDEEANLLIHRHHYYAYAVAMLQVAIALGAVAALTRRRLAWWGSAALGLVGGVLLLWAWAAG
ncbi:uncharacterized protein DUF4337 [Rhizobium sp. ERR 922]|uniref:DUF4337 family protein n=1 Tax=unclassified Rhizobium TaxID=2613769 RepID=UPI0011A6A6D7|nr:MULTISPECIES: DUF4337 family protein [unclassified Rhizobium]TWB47349.1 uncharacterized protein DUF4337 [Rhizobium sp. ERR 922]TWB91022.1 uncharacterized protein DUF4337 [Rhizobium sp. ERR 942]